MVDKAAEMRKKQSQKGKVGAVRKSPQKKAPKPKPGAAAMG